MNIVVLTGSPHRNGTTSVLTEEFIKGAEGTQCIPLRRRLS